MKTLFLFLIFLSFEALGQVKHLVFDIDGLLIQGIPQRNAGKMKAKDLVITTQESGVTRYYYVAPYAASVIRSLDMMKNIMVHFASVRDARWIDSVLNKIYVNKEKGITLANLVERDTASKILSTTDLVDGKIDLRKISSDIDHIIFLTAKRGQLFDSQEEREFFTGNPYYVFEDYASAQAEEKNESIPADENTWYLERYRFPRLNHALRKSLEKGKALAVYQAGNRQNVELGIKQTKERWQEVGPRWEITDQKVIGCSEYNNVDDLFIRNLDQSVCLSKLGVKYELVIEEKKAKACALLTQDEGALIKEAEVSQCIGKIELETHWVGRERTNCEYFTHELIRVASADVSKCVSTHYMKNPFTGQFEVVEETENFTRLSLEDIFAKRPTKGDLFELWFPYDRDPKVGFTLMSCRDPHAGHHTIREENGVLKEECRPDTLYSWGPRGKLDNLKLWMGPTTWVEKFRPLFMVRSPIGSFGYGDIPIRIKLKKGLKWVKTGQSHEQCKNLPDDEAKITVFYRPYDLGDSGFLLDYTICSPWPIESWSYGQKEHYDEIVKEHNWISDSHHGSQDFELYISGSSNPLGVWHTGIDGYDFSNSTLNKFLAEFLAMIQKKDGGIFWNPNVPVEKRTRANHFKTSVPIYFNEN